jgi:hypothetical protein
MTGCITTFLYEIATRILHLQICSYLEPACEILHNLGILRITGTDSEDQRETQGMEFCIKLEIRLIRNFKNFHISWTPFQSLHFQGCQICKDIKQ